MGPSPLSRAKPLADRDNSFLLTRSFFSRIAPSKAIWSISRIRRA